MLIWNPKAPAETVAYTDDWRADLPGDEIKTALLTVTSGSATIAEQAFCGNIITALITGGTDETTTTFNSHVETVRGQILDRTITLYVAADADVKAPATATKRLVVGMAFEEARLAGFEFTLFPDELNSALRRLDLLMEEKAAMGIPLGYNAPNIPGDGDLEDPIGIPNAALHSVALMLAWRIFPMMGKQASAETRAAYASAEPTLRAMTVTIPTMRWPANTPSGQGNRWPWRGPFMPTGRRGC